NVHEPDRIGVARLQVLYLHAAAHACPWTFVVDTERCCTYNVGTSAEVHDGYLDFVATCPTRQRFGTQKQQSQTHDQKYTTNQCEPSRVHAHTLLGSRGAPYCIMMGLAMPAPCRPGALCAGCTFVSSSSHRRFSSITSSFHAMGSES